MGLSALAGVGVKRILFLATLLLAPITTLAQTHLLIINGLGGQTEFDELFQNWSLTLLNAAENIHGIAPTHTTYLAADPEANPEPIVDGRSYKTGI